MGDEKVLNGQALTPAEVPRPGVLEWIKAKILWISEIRESSHRIALGAAIGIFVGFLPIMGIQMYVALPIAFLLGGNKLLAVAGVWLTNPLTFIPIYYTTYIFGTWIWRVDPITWRRFSATFHHMTWDKVRALGWDMLVPLWVGSFAVAVVASILTYGGTRWLVEHVRHRRGIRRPNDDEPENAPES